MHYRGSEKVSGSFRRLKVGVRFKAFHKCFSQFQKEMKTFQIDYTCKSKVVILKGALGNS